MRQSARRCRRFPGWGPRAPGPRPARARSPDPPRAGARPRIHCWFRNGLL